MGQLSAVDPEMLASLPLFADVPAKDLASLASRLQPLVVEPGRVLMRQGDQPLSFLIIGSGRAEVRHTGADGTTAVGEVSPGLIVGEIAMLRLSQRNATVIATERLSGYVGQRRALDCMLDIPDIADRLVATARQRVAAYVTPVPLQARDGTQLMLRPVLPGDGERVIHGHIMFSPETLYKRFMSVRSPTHSLMSYLAEVDYVDHFVWVVTGGADESVVADARFVRDGEDPRQAEIAFTVADAYQGRGIGTLLLGALAIAARVDGVERFFARMLADNWPMRTILDRLDPPWVRDEPGVISAVFDVPGPDDLPVELDCVKEIQAAARQVIHAFD